MGWGSFSSNCSLGGSTPGVLRTWDSLLELLQRQLPPSWGSRGEAKPRAWAVCSESKHLARAGAWM